jgi:cyanophycinase
MLRQATGIFIGGGNTPTYYHLFAVSPIREFILERYTMGVPVAGISAGALIMAYICQLTPDETGAREIQLVQGLALADKFVIGVHYNEWNALSEVLTVMQSTHIPLAFGIDEPACLVCEDGHISHVLGEHVYKIEITDFSAGTHTITPI